jgi:ABC-2 type transport system permease protein
VSVRAGVSPSSRYATCPHTGFLTHHWLDFAELLRSSPDVSALLRWSLVPLAYAAIFGAAAWARVTTADVSG